MLLRPEGAGAVPRYDLAWRGKLVIHGRAESPGWRYLKRAIAVVIRETGF